MSLRRSLVLGAVALAMTATTAQAQMMSKPKEVRIDMLGVQTVDGTTSFGIGFPGTLAIALYMNDNIAIEPSVSLDYISSDAASGGSFGLGLAVPYYLAGGQGKTGFFVAPAIEISKWLGDMADVFGDDMMLDFGVDVGLKREWKPNVGQRIALNIRTGDSTADEVAIGATFGISLRWP